MFKANRNGPLYVNCLLAAVALAVLFRVSVFAWSTFHPIPLGGGDAASPLHYQGPDLLFYAKSARLLFDRDLSDSVRELRLFFTDFNQKGIEFIAVGPLVPALIHFLDYRPGHTLPLATVYLLLAIVGMIPWLVWMRRLDLACIWLLIAALLPNPVWFMLGISLDLPFAAFFALFFFCYFVAEQGRRTQVAWLVLLLLMVLTRPNANPLVAFVFFDQLYRCWQGGDWRRVVPLALMTGLIGCIALVLHLPPMIDLGTSTDITPFFGILAADYKSGLFPALPAVIDLPLSWAMLLGAKTLYLVGLRPSYSDTSTALVLVRGLPGVVMLPGLIYLLLQRGQGRLKAMIVLYLLPIYVGATQERYLLPLMPLLVAYCGLAVRHVWESWRRFTHLTA